MKSTTNNKKNKKPNEPIIRPRTFSSVNEVPLPDVLKIIKRMNKHITGTVIRTTIGETPVNGRSQYIRKKLMLHINPIRKYNLNPGNPLLSVI